jgi:hypothetical protein
MTTIFFLGLKWTLREYSSNINGIRVTIQAKKACRGSGGKSPLYHYCSWWTAEPFEMFITSKKYFAATGIQTPSLSDRILVITPNEVPRTAGQQKSNQTFNQVRMPAPREVCLFFV